MTLDATTISETHRTAIMNLVTKINSTNKYTIDADSFDTLQKGLLDYAPRQNQRIETTYSYEKFRGLLTYLFFSFYIVLIGLSFLAFKKQWAKTLLALSILFLCTLPIILLFEGVTSIYFLVYADVCGAVSGAMYENQFPINNRGIGYFVSCFDVVSKKF